MNSSQLYQNKGVHVFCFVDVANEILLDQHSAAPRTASLDTDLFRSMFIF